MEGDSGLRQLAVLERPTGTGTLPRLNPFAFPADTDFRFVLLIATIIGASLFIFNALYFSTHDNQVAMATYLDCFTKAKTAFPTDVLGQNAFFNQCRAPLEISKALWILGATLALMIGALGWFLLIPKWKLRMGGFKPLTADDSPEVLSAVQALSREAGLRPAPTLVWQPLNAACSGLAFGRVGRHYVGLTGGLVTRFYTDQAAFRAIVLHELGHLRNADVDKTYFTIAVWWAFVVGALLPFALVGIVTRSPGSTLGLGWRVLALGVLVYLTRNAVLRAREAYADVRASAWEGSSGALRRVVHGLPDTPSNFLRRFIALHPKPAEREALISRPEPLFRIGFWEAFATGLAVAIAFPTIESILSLLTTGMTNSILYVSINQMTYLLVGALLAPLVVGVVGLGTWRANFAAAAQRHASPDVSRMALGLGAGAIVGLWLALPAALDSSNQPSGAQLFASLVVDTAWSVVLLTTLFLFLRWMLGAAAAWLGHSITRASPRPNYVVALIVGSALLAGWFAVLFLAHDILHTAVANGFDPASIGVALTVVFGGIFILAEHPLTLLALLGIWAYPAMASVLRRDGPVSSWLFLESAARPPVWSTGARFQFRRGLLLSLATAGGFLVLVFVLRLGMVAFVPSTFRSQDEYKIMLFTVQVGLAVLMQALAAAVAARRFAWLSAIHGIYVAFIAAVLMAAEMLTVNLFFGGSIDAGFAWTTISLIVNLGGLFALVVAAIASSIPRHGGQVIDQRAELGGQLAISQ
jgi:Zn-dependent protease with chaperone function